MSLYLKMRLREQNGSSHHIEARIIVFSEKMIFHALNHRRLALSLWVFLTFSRLSQNQL